MFDLFGIGKEAQLKDIMESVSKGVTLGLLEAFEWRLDEKQTEIERLKLKIEELERKTKV